MIRVYDLHEMISCIYMRKKMWIENLSMWGFDSGKIIAMHLAHKLDPLDFH
jgi:hypothetical protein